MPVRSLSSSVLAWPNRAQVEAALAAWTSRQTAGSSSFLAIGYFGSYARGDWGPGSDLDLIVVVRPNDLPFEQRASRLDTSGLPVPADALVYTPAELAAMTSRGGRFSSMLQREAKWLWIDERSYQLPWKAGSLRG